MEARSWELSLSRTTRQQSRRPPESHSSARDAYGPPGNSQQSQAVEWKARAESDQRLWAGVKKRNQLGPTRRVCVADSPLEARQRPPERQASRRVFESHLCQQRRGPAGTDRAGRSRHELWTT